MTVRDEVQSCCNPGPCEIVVLHKQVKDGLARRQGADYRKMGWLCRNGWVGEGKRDYGHPPCRGKGEVSYSGSGYAATI